MKNIRFATIQWVTFDQYGYKSGLQKIDPHVTLLVNEQIRVNFHDVAP